MSNTPSPAMAQWFTLKATHPDALLFFRMGDFFELFFDDAIAAAAALDIALTKRGEHAGAPIPMCGVPVANAEHYLARLIRRGFRVAVAEQTESAEGRSGKGPLRREIVRLVTPGTLTEDALLEGARPNFLLALASGREGVGAAWLDMSTGSFETARCDPAGLNALLCRLDPAELLAPDGLDLGEFASRRAPGPAPARAEEARRRLAAAFGAASLDAFGSFSDLEAIAAALALDYVRLTQAGRLPRLSRPVASPPAGMMAMDGATRRSLEITQASDGGTALTLLACVRRTVTAAGARLLGEWLASPLAEAAPIDARQEGWAFLLGAPGPRAAFRAALARAPDLARALGRIALGRASPRDLTAIRDALAVAQACREALAPPMPPILARARAALDPAPDLAPLLQRALAEAPPARFEDGAIRDGFDGELDAERRLRDDSRRVIAGLQMQFCERYGVAALKIRHHAQLGYVIEAPAAAVEALRARPELVLRQGMANGARFTHPDLSDLDRRINEASARASARERAIVAYLCETILKAEAALADCARALAVLDVLHSAASLAEDGWCRPVLDEGEGFAIVGGRHPVVEHALAGRARFVPNDCDLSPARRLLLLTGPNMAGKSTFLRQNALAVILAQAGLPVPAHSMRAGIVDRLFSRVGAADELARGRSTFMVEMTETAAILHQAGPRSLVIVDEIGRGTATLDGLAIAWAVLEALHSQIRCRTIFATHFHELARLGESLPRLAPSTMRVREWRGEIVFLHEVAPGAGGRSWGVHVAKLAGVPGPVVQRAATLLAALERGRAPVLQDLPLFGAIEAPTPEPCPRGALLAGIDPNGLSPRDALACLYRLLETRCVADLPQNEEVPGAA